MSSMFFFSNSYQVFHRISGLLLCKYFQLPTHVLYAPVPPFYCRGNKYGSSWNEYLKAEWTFFKKQTRLKIFSILIAVYSLKAMVKIKEEYIQWCAIARCNTQYISTM